VRGQRLDALSLRLRAQPGWDPARGLQRDRANRLHPADDLHELRRLGEGAVSDDEEKRREEERKRQLEALRRIQEAEKAAARALREEYERRRREEGRKGKN
jgi:hypothetical protein